MAKAQGLVTCLSRRLKKRWDRRYTYLYDGNSQALDHMLVSPALYDLFAAVDVLHFNASYPDGLGDDASTPLRASDHDPLEGRFTFQQDGRGRGRGH